MPSEPEVTPDPTPAANGAEPAPQLPRRPPRSIWIHLGIDFLVAFLALVLVFWILGLPLWLTIVVAWVIAIVAAPFTRRAECRALAERPEPA